MAAKTKTKQTRREWKVWVRPTVNDELVLYDQTTIFTERGSRKHFSKTVPATLTLTFSKPKRRKAK